MKNKPLVSVIMNCFNGQDYLRQSVESVFSQTYENWELIFWDNQSNDQSVEIFREYKDDRLKFFSAAKHTVLYEARNQAIQKTRGELVAFLDTDDYWLPLKLEKQVKLFENEEIGLVYGNYWILNEQSVFKKKIFSGKKLPTGKILNQILSHYSVGLLTIMLRRKCLKNIKNVFNVEYDLLGDFDFVIDYAIDHEFDCVQEPVACYRMHNKQTSLTLIEKQIPQMEKWFLSKQKHPVLSSQKEMPKVLENINYMKSIKTILKGSFFQALYEVFKFPFIFKKLKFFINLNLRKRFLKN